MMNGAGDEIPILSIDQNAIVDYDRQMADLTGVVAENIERRLRERGPQKYYLSISAVFTRAPHGVEGRQTLQFL
jgi:hypothetical protein